MPVPSDSSGLAIPNGYIFPVVPDEPIHSRRPCSPVVPNGPVIPVEDDGVVLPCSPFSERTEDASKAEHATTDETLPTLLSSYIFVEEG